MLFNAFTLPASLVLGFCCGSCWRGRFHIGRLTPWQWRTVSPWISWLFQFPPPALRPLHTCWRVRGYQLLQWSWTESLYRLQHICMGNVLIHCVNWSYFSLSGTQSVGAITLTVVLPLGASWTACLPSSSRPCSRCLWSLSTLCRRTGGWRSSRCLMSSGQKKRCERGMGHT